MASVADSPDVINGPMTSPTHGYVLSQKTAVNFNPQAEDCYFYFYSACMKGDECKFRHCSAALGSEQVCEQWNMTASCSKAVCPFRHTAMLRQRSVIPCYWENQPQGCLKPHCPFMHLKPRPEPMTALHRLSEYKVASIKIKTVEELKKEREKKETEEKMKEEDKELMELQRDLNLRRELMKRILAEKAAYDKRLQEELEKKKTREEMKSTQAAAPRLERRKGEEWRLEERRPASELVPKKALRRPTELNISSSPRKKKLAMSATHKHDVSRKKRKVHSQNNSTGSKRSGTESKVNKSSHKAVQASGTSAVTATPTSRISAPVVTETLPPDFKVKTLEELKKERALLSQPSRSSEDEPVTQNERASLCTLKDAQSQNSTTSSKKVILVRRRRSSEVLSTLSIDSDHWKPIQNQEKRSKIDLIPEEDSRQTSATTDSNSNIPKSESNPILSSIITSKSNSDYLHSVPVLGVNYDSVAAESRLSRKHLLESQGSARKRRRVSLVRRKRDSGVAGHKRNTSEDVIVDIDSTLLGERISITDLKNELFGDVEDTLSVEDKELLEEMAQFENLPEEGGAEGSSGLSSSRNDDELLLQMEEFM